MRYARLLHPRLLRGFVQSLAVMAVTFLLASAAGAQAANAQQPFSPDDLKKFSGVLTELGQFFQKIHTNVQFPAPRGQSHLLPLLPEATVLYAGFPNYGEASHQALAVFHQELKENAKLRAWWEQGDMAKEGPKIEDALEKIYELSQYLGDEIVVGAAPSTGKEDPKFVILAEVRKPGLKDLLPKILKDFAEKSTPAIRVLDVTELAGVKDAPSSDQPVILVRPDLVILGETLATLRRFNARLEQNAQGLASTEFGRRLAQGYEGGATIVAGLDVQTILKKEGPKEEKDRAMLERTGFSDMKYVVWDHKIVNGQETSQFELSFTGPRRGVASWVAAPGPMGSLDFVSPKAAIAASILLKDPQTIYDEAADLATASNPNALASLAQMEQGLKLSLREDLLGRLGGEITLELDTLPPQDPVWKILLRVRDPRGLLATLKTFFVASRIIPTELDEDGITYYTLPIPGQKPLEIGYAVVDGYLIVASSHAALADAIRLHRSGESLAKSGKLAASLPAGNSADVSALLYEDPRAMAALGLMRVSPELASSLLKSTEENQPAVVAVLRRGDNLARSQPQQRRRLRRRDGGGGDCHPQFAARKNGGERGECRSMRSHLEHRASRLLKHVPAERLCPRPCHSRSGPQRIKRHLCETCQSDRLQFGRCKLHRRRMVHQVWISLHHYDRMQAAKMPRVCSHCHTCEYQHRDAQLVFYL